MDVLGGPTFVIEVAASATTAYAGDRPQEKISSSCLFLKEDDDCGDDPTHCHGSLDVSSESSSSLGAPGDSDDEEEEGIVSSGGDLGLASLEDSLPIKGLSSHYAGKSKSFGNLSDINSVKDLQKEENPFNKRRRMLIANKWYGKSSFYSSRNPNSMPLLTLNEDDEYGNDEETPSSSVATTKPKLQQSKLKSQSCFSLTDLQVNHQ